MMKKELWHLSETRSTIKNNEIQFLQEDSLLIQSHYSMISTGSERLVAMGKVPAVLHEKMQVPYMLGQFDFPVSYGYSLAGEIIDGENNLRGRYVHCLHPHHSYAMVKHSDIFLIPPEIPLKRAAMASNLETIVNAIWDSHCTIGDNILIAGFGIIGALLAVTLKSFPGVNVTLLEINPAKRSIAEKLGFECHPPHKKIHDAFDMAFHCSSSDQGLQACINHTGLEGTIMELSWYGNKQTNIHLGESFHSQRKKIHASQVSSIPAEKSSRWDIKRRKELVFKLLHNPDYDKLITKEIDFETAPEFFTQLRKGHHEDIGVIIKY